MTSQETPRLERWDNPVPMFCDSKSRQAQCSADAQFIRLADDGETVIAFRCWRHRYDE